MTEFTLVTRDGISHTLKGRTGVPLMEIIRDAGHDEMVAMCGGSMACATCHVFVRNLPVAASLPAMSGDEDTMLDCTEYREAGSRLSCQVQWDDSFSGMTVQIAPED